MRFSVPLSTDILRFSVNAVSTRYKAASESVPDAVFFIQAARTAFLSISDNADKYTSRKIIFLLNIIVFA